MVFRWSCLKVVLIFSTLILLAGCPPGPILDNTLSPPQIHGPIYACAKIVGFAGADRDSKIIIYVDGVQVAEKNTWWHWGSVTLPNPLVAGDVVSAAQVVDNRISEKTREPVTVLAIPVSQKPGHDLTPPEIVPPLYECQRIVVAKDTLPGATVTIRNNASDTWEQMTPYVNIRIGTPELKLGDQYDAMQEICEDPPYTSDWSTKVTVQAKPIPLPEPELREPLVAGHDACTFEGLIVGAKTDIYADDGSGKVRVGGGIAPGEATIFLINPPIDAGSKYTATQSLCDDVSPESPPATPVTAIPSPTIQEPICDGEFYVTVCDNIPVATIKVYVNGTQVAQASGGIGCVTMALGDATTFSTGQVVTAKHFIASGASSSASASVTVRASGAPTYAPSSWNVPAHQLTNNCYNYACDMMLDAGKAQPGKAHGITLYSPLACTNVGDGAKADGLKHMPEKQCRGCTHLVALAIADDPDHNDYHWYRLDNNGRWSHKPGLKPVTDRDASGNFITNPETADRRTIGPDYTIDYRVFCTYYCVDKKIVKIE